MACEIFAAQAVSCNAWTSTALPRSAHVAICPVSVYLRNLGVKGLPGLLMALLGIAAMYPCLLQCPSPGQSLSGPFVSLMHPMGSPPPHQLLPINGEWMHDERNLVWRDSLNIKDIFPFMLQILFECTLHMEVLTFWASRARPLSNRQTWKTLFLRDWNTF